MVQSKAETTRQNILDACQALILQKGFSATSINDICKATGLTKGAFFYHYASKDELGKAVMSRWSELGEQIMSSVVGADPVETLFGCIDLMVSSATQSGNAVGCVVGEISQESGPSNSMLAEVAASSFDGAHARFQQMITDAADHLGVKQASEGEFARMAWSLQAAFQGSMVVARAKQDPAVITAVLNDYKQSLKARFSLT